MNTTPSNPQLKIPTFNTSTFRFAQLNPVRQNINTIPASSKGVTAGTTKKQTVRLTAPSTFTNATTNITTTKISVDGRVIDIDVLTKLHQNNGGNIVSFTASKELLSNLANNKLPSVGGKVTSQQIVTSKPTKTMAVAVYGNQGSKQYNQGTISSNPTPVKVYSEKFLLPKTTFQSAQYPITKPCVEVKKFVPEMNGLLTGLSTALRTPTAPSSTNFDPKNLKTFTLKNQASVTPVAISFVTDPKSQKGTTTMILPANKSASPTSNFKKQNTTVKSIVHNPVQPQILGKSILYNARNIIQAQNSQTIFQPTTNTITKTNKANGGRVSAPTPAIVENKIYRMNKNLMENNKKNSFKIHTLLLQDVLKKESVMMETNKKEKAKTNIDGFDKLYEDAVNNVLKIKAFPDDLDSKKNKQTLREIKEEFKQYLETPMDIENKINEGVYKYSKKRSSPTENNEAPTEKKPKLIDSAQLEKYLKGDSSSTSYTNPLSERVSSSFETKPTAVQKPIDSQNFFSQFLTDKTKIPTPFNAHTYFSPMDYPWFYPTYFYDPNFYANRPPPLLPHPPPTTNIQASTSTKVKQEESEESDKSPSSEKKTRTRSVTNSLSKKGLKQNMKENIKKDDAITEKISKFQKPNTQSIKSTKINKKENDKKAMLSNKKGASVKRESNTYKLNNEKKNKTLNTSNVSQISISAEKRLRNKDNLKFRYSLRQRAKALKKAKKLAKLNGEESPKFILKKLDKRTSTKKELFLATLGLRRILKRIDPKPKLGKE